MKIHPTAIIDSSVELGSNVVIGPYSVIRGHVQIGDNTYVASHVSIGECAEHYTDKYEVNYQDGFKQIIIGNNVIIKEFTTVNGPMADKTIISDNCYISSHSHISHDNILEEGVSILHATLGGWTKILKGANVGLNATTRQFTVIGQYAIIGAGATVVKDIPPFYKYIPGKDPASNAAYITKKLKMPYPGTKEFEELLNELTSNWMLKRYMDHGNFKNKALMCKHE